MHREENVGRFEWQKTVCICVPLPGPKSSLESISSVYVELNIIAEIQVSHGIVLDCKSIKAVSFQKRHLMSTAEDVTVCISLLLVSLVPCARTSKTALVLP